MSARIEPAMTAASAARGAAATGAHGATSAAGGWLSTLDHRRIALGYLAVIASMFVLGTTFALLVRLELVTAGEPMLAPTLFARLLSMHGIVMVLCCALPGIPAALGHYVLPLMLGAPNLAFPALARSAFRLYLAGVVAILLAILTGAVASGWELVPPYAPASRLPLVLLGVGMHVIGLHLVFTGLNFVVTLERCRATATGWFDLPVVAWTLATTSLVGLVTGTILASLGFLVIAQSRGVEGLFDPASGGDPLAWLRAFWRFGHPALVVALVAAIGVVGEIFVTFCRKPLHAYRTSVVALFAFGVLGIAGWGVHLIASGLDPAATTVASAMTLLAAVPAAMLLTCYLATLYRGAIEPATPFLYAVAALVQLVIAGLAALFLAALGTAIGLAGTTFATATLHYVMVGGVTTAFIAGVHYWWPLMTGRRYDERWGVVGLVLVVLGVQLAFVGMFALGARGLPLRQQVVPPEMADWQMLSTVGAVILVAGLAVAALNLIRSLVRGTPAPANPWGATTREWEATATAATLATGRSANADDDAASRPLYDFSHQTFDEASGGYARVEDD